jgi:hypothetical protein
LFEQHPQVTACFQSWTAEVDAVLWPWRVEHLDVGEASVGEHTAGVWIPQTVPSPAPPSASEMVRQCIVRWYLRYGLSYRDVEDLLAERGITVDHVTIYWWVQRFTPI